MSSPTISKQRRAQTENIGLWLAEFLNSKDTAHEACRSDLTDLISSPKDLEALQLIHSGTEQFGPPMMTGKVVEVRGLPKRGGKIEGTFRMVLSNPRKTDDEWWANHFLMLLADRGELDRLRRCEPHQHWYFRNRKAQGCSDGCRTLRHEQLPKVIEQRKLSRTERDQVQKLIEMRAAKRSREDLHAQAQKALQCKKARLRHFASELRATRDRKRRDSLGRTIEHLKTGLAAFEREFAALLTRR